MNRPLVTCLRKYARRACWLIAGIWVVTLFTFLDFEGKRVREAVENSEEIFREVRLAVGIAVEDVTTQTPDSSSQSMTENTENAEDEESDTRLLLP